LVFGNECQLYFIVSYELWYRYGEFRQQ